MDKEQALNLHFGQVLYHRTYRNADGTPERWRVNGRVKTWKTRPADFQVPIKRGLREFAYLTQWNADNYALSESEAMS